MLSLLFIPVPSPVLLQYELYVLHLNLTLSLTVERRTVPRERSRTEPEVYHRDWTKK